MLVNLSNHPSQNWSLAQISAGHQLANGIQDVEFPEVPAEWDTEEVKQLAQLIVDGIVQMNASVAMVQGEGTMMYWLVQYLERSGVSCYAATSRRIVSVIEDSTGSAIKQSRFEFVRFRRFEA
jgi:hypothetical protein